MRFSLIVATFGRVEELKDLLSSLAAQTCQDFEVIIVDQNPDDCLGWIGEGGQYPFRILRKRSSVRRLSHARNIGLHIASGEIVAFPDDDCTYPPGVLAMVDQAFREQHGLGVRTGPAIAPDGRLGSGRWQRASGVVSIDNVWLCAIAFNIFLLRHLAMSIGGFDEKLGVGAEFGSAEDTDLVLRTVQTGWCGWYDTRQLVVHPDKSLTPVAIDRAFSYGAGFGYVLRKHNFPTRVWATFLLRPMGGCLISLACGRFMHARYYWHTLAGRVFGLSVRQTPPKQGLPMEMPDTLTG